MRMTIKIELMEKEDGHIKSRVAVGVDTSELSKAPPNYALLDHMLRKVDDCLIEAKAQLVKQTTLQNLQPTVEAPL